jgi:putative PIN family toxin of toxin-antitoxin system
MNPQPACRVVFDTNVVLSALLFSAGRLAWLRAHWREGGSVPLISPATARELTRVLGYSKFRLSREYCTELLAMYVPYCESLDPADKCPIACRDVKDQPLLDLAHGGKADLLVTGDQDLLALARQTAFLIETPEAYRRRVLGIEVRS